MRHVVVSDASYVSEVYGASIFRVNSENWSSIYLRNIGYITHNRAVQQLKNKINIDN
jgi:hypothetical protein